MRVERSPSAPTTIPIVYRSHAYGLCENWSALSFVIGKDRQWTQRQLVGFRSRLGSGATTRGSEANTSIPGASAIVKEHVPTEPARHYLSRLRLRLVTVKIFGSSNSVFVSFSTLVNIILASLIVLQLIYHQRRIRKILGVDHGSKIIIMCVESSALIVIFSTVYSIPLKSSVYGSLIPFLLLPHICVGALNLHDI